MARAFDGQEFDLPHELVPKRLSFVPGDKERASFGAVYRELEDVDAPQVQEIARALRKKLSARDILRFIKATGWTGRGVFRNDQTCVALTLLRHLGTDKYNELRLFWVHPDYIETKVCGRLLALARLELPERPTRVSVVGVSDQLKTFLLGAGFSEVEDGIFYAGSIGEREYRATLRANGQTRQPPARSGG